MGEDLRNESPRINLENYSDLESALHGFIKKKNNLLNALKKGESCVCTGCPSAIRKSEREWDALGDPSKIGCLAISLSYPCQLACNYCGLLTNKRFIHDNKDFSEQQKNFDIIRFMQLLEEKQLLKLTEPIQLSAGEISIHPNRKAILDCLGKYPLQVFSNCVKYDQQISDIISRNDGSFLNVSIDSGTEKTYHAVKGGDFFANVQETLKKYAENGAHIHAKYIILKDNCTNDDLDGFIDICASIHAERINISCDITVNHSNLDAYIKDAAVHLALSADRVGIPYTILPYFGDENMAYINEKILELRSSGYQR